MTNPRTCRTCNQTKPIRSFYTYHRRTLTKCSQCVTAASRVYSAARKAKQPVKESPVVSETKVCRTCKKDKLRRNFYTYDGHNWAICKQCICAARKADYESRKEHFALKSAKQNKRRDDRRVAGNNNQREMGK